VHHFHALTVQSVTPLTRDSAAITLAVPAQVQDKFHYTPGQYLTLRTQLDGAELRRSYSICASAQSQQLRVAIKRVSGGAFSNWALDTLKPGQAIEVMPPQGHFTTPLAAVAQRHVLCVAAGSGITPVLSIVESTLLAEPDSRVTLVYGNHASGSVMFKEELENLKDRFLTRLNIVWVMSRETQDVPLFNGRIDGDKITQILQHWVDASTVDVAFICGPQSMMLAASQAMQDAGIAKERIKVELFGTANTGERATRVVAASDTGCEVTVVMDGAQRVFHMPKDQNLVDAALAQGIELPYSCKGGVCSTCRCKVTQGEVDRDINYALEDYEVARGFVLGCQSYPVSDKLVIDYDAEQH
jgi:ring-1,2-phenylacetyl-CoA epoxidase subunit PaaE